VINPKTILGEWVTALQSCPDLVDALGGDGDNIRAFMEGLATDNNLRLAILQMPPGSILVAWNGTTPRRLTGGSLHFAHRFSIYLRAPEQDSTATYADLAPSAARRQHHKRRRQHHKRVTLGEGRFV
jgi:hypothetical protein